MITPTLNQCATTATLGKFYHDRFWEASLNEIFDCCELSEKTIKRHIFN